MLPPMPAGPSADAPVPAPLSPIVFSNESLPHGQRLEAWNARFRSLNDVSVPDPSASNLLVRNENWLLGGMLFSTNMVAGCRFERRAAHLRKDGLDHWVVRTLRQGHNRMMIGGTCHHLMPGQPFLFSLSEPWSSEWTDGSWLSLCLPRDAFPDIAAGLASLGVGPLAGEGARLFADYLLMLEQHLRDAPAERVPLLADATRAMLAACLLRNVAPRAVTPEAVGAAQFERVRALVRQHLASPLLNAERLARMLGMSRSVLYRLMEPHGGVACYIQTLRLRVAHALLSDPALAAFPVAQLAERVGFFDASSFSRAFRAAFGYSPREARTAAMAGMRLPGRLAGPEAEREVEDFGRLLRQVGALPGGRVSGGEARAPAP
jgi:AraC-like DNA-binding protein